MSDDILYVSAPSTNIGPDCNLLLQNPLLASATVVEASSRQAGDASTSSSSFTFSVPKPVHVGLLLPCNVLLCTLDICTSGIGLYTSGYDLGICLLQLAPKVATRPGKIPLEKGYSQMDWLRLSKTLDLAGEHTDPLALSL